MKLIQIARTFCLIFGCQNTQMQQIQALELLNLYIKIIYYIFNIINYIISVSENKRHVALKAYDKNQYDRIKV